VSADLQTILNALNRARTRLREGDGAEHILGELLDATYAPAVRLRAARSRESREPRNTRSWAEADNDRRNTL
jgi:hypothetical protein